MALTKITWIFQQRNVAQSGQTPARIGGWSESVVFPLSSMAEAMAFATAIGNQRSELLGAGAGVVGCRIQQVEPVLRAVSRALNLPGKRTEQSDISQMSIFVNIPSATGNANRRLTLRGIPDDFVRTGEFGGTDIFNRALAAYLVSLNNRFFRARTPATVYPLLNVQANGTFITTLPHPFVAGNIIQVQGSVTSQGRRKGGIFVVSAAPTTTTGTLADWPWGLTRGGKLRPYPAWSYLQMDTRGIVPGMFVATTRKVGRPSFALHGAQRRTAH